MLAVSEHNESRKINFLALERETINHYLPGLDAKLQELSFNELEQPGNPGIPMFKEYHGAGLVIPTKYAGLGATPLDVVRIQRAIGARSPSLAVATTMHHFSVATIVETLAGQGGVDWLLMEAIARQGLLVASGFAEGRTNAGILTPYMRLRRSADGLTVSGSKKPCSLSHSMDLLTLSLIDPDGDIQGERLAIALVPANSPGLTRRPFWKSKILAGAESEEIVLNDVPVPREALFYSGTPGEMDAMQVRGFLWFELILASSYLGVASALVERVLVSERGSPEERSQLAIEVEGAMSALEGLAHAIAAGSADERVLAQALFVRFSVQAAIERTSMRATELLGGIAFITEPEIAYLLSASRALAFHPPSRLSIAAELDRHLTGQELHML